MVEDHLKLALQKAASFCAYQERTQQEVRERLADWDVTGDDADAVIVELIEQNYLNEGRFAETFAGGKFRVKGWGRRKIRQHLQQRGITGRNLDDALRSAAPDDEYRAKLATLLEKKRQSLRDDNPLVIKQKLARYALAKGYESELIWQVLGGEE